MMRTEPSTWDFAGIRVHVQGVGGDGFIIGVLDPVAEVFSGLIVVIDTAPGALIALTIEVGSINLNINALGRSWHGRIPRKQAGSCWEGLLRH